MSVTVSEAMKTPALRRCRLVAGEQGVSRLIEAVTVMEMPDIVQWLRGNELVLTSCYAIRDDESALAELVPLLADRNVAAIGLKPGNALSSNIPEVMLDFAHRLGLPLIEMPQEVTYRDVIQEVSEAVSARAAGRLARSQEIQTSLTDVSLRGGDMKEVLALLHGFIGHPVMVQDLHGRIVSLAGMSRGDLDPTPSVPKENGGPDSRTDFTLNGVGRVRSVFPLEGGGQPLGYLSVVAHPSEMGEMDLIAVRHAVSVLVLELLRERAVAEAEKRFINDLIRDLVSADGARPDDLLRRAAFWGWETNIQYLPVVAQVRNTTGGSGETPPPADDRALRRLAADVEAVFRSHWPQAIVGTRGPYAVVLVPLEAEKIPLERVREMAAGVRARLEESGQSLETHFGIAEHGAPLAALQEPYAEALRALEFARRSGKSHAVSYGEMGIYRFLCAINDSNAVEEFAWETLHPLLTLESSYSATLMETLRAFCRTNGNVARVAEDLYIHYNTAQYRMRRIEDILGMDLSSAEDFLTVHTALKAWDMTIARGGGQPHARPRQKPAGDYIGF